MKTSHIPVGCQGWAHRAAQRSSPPGPVGTEPSSPGRGWSCQTRQINISGARASLSTLKSGMELIEKVKGKKKKKVKSALILSSKRKLGKNLSLHTNQLELNKQKGPTKATPHFALGSIYIASCSHNTGIESDWPCTPLVQPPDRSHPPLRRGKFT